MDKIFKAGGRLGDYYAQSMLKFSYSIVSRALISAGLLLDLSYAMICMIIVTCNDEAVCIHTVKPCITLLGQVHLYNIFFPDIHAFLMYVLCMNIVITDITMRVKVWPMIFCGCGCRLSNELWTLHSKVIDTLSTFFRHASVF